MTYRRHRDPLVFAACLLIAVTTAFAAKFDDMDYGPAMALTADLEYPAGNTVLKGLAIKLETALAARVTGPVGAGRLRESKKEVEGTDLQEVYGTQRTYTDGFLIHVPKGTYDVTLLFAEIWRKKEGYRVADVYLQDKLVLPDFDVAKEVDRYVKLDKTFKDVVVDGYHLAIKCVEKGRYNASFAGIIIKGANGYERKINFGGPAVHGFEAGWDEEYEVAAPFVGGAIFDTELLRWGGAWTEGFLELRGTLYDDSHGPYPAMNGTQLYGAGAVPGWFPRGADVPTAVPAGNHFVGHNHNGKDVLVSFTTLGGTVQEHVAFKRVTDSSTQSLVRTVNARGLTESGSTVVCQIPTNATVSQDGPLMVATLPDNEVLALAATSGRLWFAEDTRLALLDFAAGDQNRAVLHWRGNPDDLPKFKAFAAKQQAVDLAPLAAPADRVWNEDVTVAGQLYDGDDEDAPYVVDTVTLPDNNPWDSWIRVSGIDFLPGGTKAAIATWSGDVWTVDGLGGDLAELTWQRVAAGLFNPLGLKIRDGKIYVNGRDQITLLEDRNGDGETDFYRNFNNDVKITSNFHEFSFGLEIGSDGWFYLVKAGPVKHGGRGFDTATEHNGAMMRISPDGKTLETFATGFRAPNGMSIGPDGTITTSDNEGSYMPTTPVNRVSKGDFFGVAPLGHRDPLPERTMPLTWIPHNVCNSGGGQVWVTSDRWGPLKGELIHLSYGTCQLFHVLQEKVGDTHQGGVALLDVAGRIGSGIMRGDFSEADGQLYVGGLKGWQTRALYDGGLYRIRYREKPLRHPMKLEVGQNGVRIRFSTPLDKASAEDPGNYAVEQWQYLFSDGYGSAHYKPSNPKEKGQEVIDVRSVTMIDDQTVFLEIPGIAPVNQMQIHFDAKAADGTRLEQTVWNTIHQLGDWSGEAKAVVAETRRDDLLPGLTLKTRVSKTTDWLDARPARMAALHVPEGSPVSPVFAHGTDGQPFEAELSGFLQVKKKTTANFSLAGNGRALLYLNGKLILDATGDDLGAAAPVEVALRKGDAPIRLNYSPPATGDATVRLYWQSDDFPREPIPATALAHDPADSLLRTSQLIRRGRQVYADYGCAACHGDQPTGQNAMPEATRFGPALNGAGSRLSGKWLAAWLRNPQSLRPGTVMPTQVNKLPPAKRDQAAADLGAYLASLNGPAPAFPAGDAANGKKLYDTLGCVSCHSPEAVTPSTGMPDRISLADVANKFNTGALAAFLKNPNAHDPANRMPDFSLTNQEAADLAAHLRTFAPRELPKLVAGDAGRGKALFAKMNCAACHQTNGHQPNPRLPSLFSGKGSDLAAKVGLHGPNSCLAPANPENTRFFISAPDQKALTAFLKTDPASLNRDPIAEFAHRRFDALQCSSCHQRDGQQATWGEGAKGIPALHHLGEKLDAEWLRDFLAGEVADKPRPWLQARMPAFPQDADRLAAGLCAEHGFGTGTQPTDAATAIGKTLLGSNGGFACTICHGVGDQKALAAFEAPGINLLQSKARLRHEFFIRWMLNPQRVDPQTKMPRFALPDGKSPLTNHFNGDATQQFDAIWNHLQSLEK